MSLGVMWGGRHARRTTTAAAICVTQCVASLRHTMRRQLVASGLLALQRIGAASAEQQALGLCHLARRGFADDANLKKTVLYDFHVAHGGACAAAERGAWRHWRWINSLRCGFARRQDGAVRRLEHANPVQGQHHGLHHALPAARVCVRRQPHVLVHAQGKSRHCRVHQRPLRQLRATATRSVVATLWCIGTSQAWVRTAMEALTLCIASIAG